MNIRDKIAEYFEKMNIEFYSVLSYGDCNVCSPHIIEREGFAPRSVIVYLLPYYGGETVNLSRYAASRDYHIALATVNAGLFDLIKSGYPEAMLKGYGDHSPINECHAALIGGLGILGDNGLLINQKYGSYVFVGDMITDIPIEDMGVDEKQEIRHCHRCGACKEACPTGILRGESADCLSAVTQKKGELSPAEEELMIKYNTVWGCDLCQCVCPYNRNPIITPIPFFKEDRISHLTCDVLSAMDKEQFKERAFAWRGRKTVERNVALLEKQVK